MRSDNMKKMIFPVITELEERLPFYVSGVGIEYEQEDINRIHGHPKYQWIQTRTGRGELFINDKRFVIGPSQGMLLFPNEAHSYHAIDPEWDVDWIIFRGTEIENFIKNVIQATHSDVYFISSPAKISTKLEELYYSAFKRPNTVSKCSTITYNILLDIMELTSKSKKASLDDNLKKIEPVIRFISENYKSPITLPELASLVQMTPQHLCTVFKKCTGLTIFEFINRTKISAAKELLGSNTNMLIKEVALLSGFSDESYFCALFRRYEKISPAEFRNIHR